VPDVHSDGPPEADSWIFADDARESVLHADLDQAHATIEQMQAALRTSGEVATAVGILMARCLVTDEQAMALLNRMSQQARVDLMTVAREVVEGDLEVTLADDGRHLVKDAIRRGDKRDAAAAARSAAARLRDQAALSRDRAAEQREASGDLSGAKQDREAANDDRDAAAMDVILAGRDMDEAAGDRALIATEWQGTEGAGANGPLSMLD
jgi:hypothetical protein